jgi:flagellar M-ring protein FliF
MDQPLSPLPARDADAAADRDPPPLGARVAGVLRSFGVGRLLILSATGLALLACFGYLLLGAIEPPYTLLYGSLELDDSAQIVTRLEALGVPYRLRGDGDAILVPADQALRLRMTLAEENLPRGGTVGDEIFDTSSALGTTDFLANVNLRRALEGELARTIGALADVRSARVHLVLPRHELFQRDQIQPSASITLRMQGGRRLNHRQVQAIQHLVAAAVPGLVPERTTIVDDQGTLLARGGDGAGENALPSQAEDFREAYEARLKQTIEQLLERSLGPGRVQAEVSADLDFDQVTMTEETYDPNGQVVRSTQTVEETKKSSARDDNTSVSVGNNLPNAAANTPPAGRTSNDDTSRTDETVNYEISHKVSNHTQAGGRVRRLSVAVLVDGKMAPNATGDLVYTPRDAAELSQIESLVRSAIGFDATRGDVVEVKNMPFSLPPPAEAEPTWPLLTTADLMRLAELAALALVALMLILLVVRPALRRLAPPPARAALAGAGAPAALLAGDQARAALAAPGSAPGPAATGAPEATDEGGVHVDPQAEVRAELIKQARQVIDDAPDRAVAIIRSWLYET